MSHPILEVSLDGRGTLGRLHGMNKNMGEAKEQKVQRASQPQEACHRPAGAVSGVSGDFILRHPLYLSVTSHLINFLHILNCNDYNTISTWTPCKAFNCTASGQASLWELVPEARQISNLHKYLSQRGMSPCLKYYK